MKPAGQRHRHQVGGSRSKCRAQTRPCASAATHELQARRAARRFVAGDSRLHLGLTAAPAAGYVEPGSPGIALPQLLRRDFETAFGADLGAVRLHSDERSAAAASVLAAEAFTSGTHIYFAAGELSPFSLAGRELLAHEVAHVLQQTARAGSRAQLVATPRTGSGAVQCAPSFQKLRSLHSGDATTEEPSYKAIADELAALGNRASVEKFAEGRKAELAKWSDGSISLLYDVAKSAGAFPLAASLIELDNFKGGLRISTTFHEDGVEDELVKRSLGQFVFERAITRIPDLKLYRSEWLRLIEMFLLQPIDRKTPRLQRNLDPEAGSKSTKWEDIQTHTEAVAKSYTGDQRTVNEWYLRGLEHLYRIDHLRLKACDRARTKALQLNQWSAWIQRMTLVTHLRQFATEIRKPVELGRIPIEKWQLFHESIADAVTKILDKIEGVFATLDRFRDARRQLFEEKAKGEKLDPETVAQYKAIAALALRSGLAATLAGILTTLNASDRKRNRVPANYAEISLKQAEALGRILRTQIDDKVPYWYRAGKTSDLIAGLWIQKELEPVFKLLRFEWNPFVLPKSSGKGAPTASPELVRGHRILAARELSYFGDELGLRTVTAAARAILTAEVEDESVLALLPDEKGDIWQQSDIAAETVIKDFSSVPLRGSEPLSAYDYVLLYHIEYLENLRTQLDLVLPADAAAEKQAIQSRSLGKGILAGSAKTVRDTMDASGHRPQRWALEGRWRRSYFAQKKGGKTFGTLLFEHLATQKFYTDAVARGMRAFLPIEEPAQNAFVWFWPPYDKIPWLLRQISELNELVALKRFGRKDETSLKKVREASDNNAWLDDLRKILQIEMSTDPTTKKQLSADELKALLKRVRDAVSSHLEQTERALEPLIHKATRIDRQMLASDVRGELAAYEADRLRTMIPLRQAELVHRFYTSLLILFSKDVVATTDPDTGHEKVTIAASARPRLHLASLLLEIATAMDTAFERERSGQIVLAYLGLLEDGHESALEFAKMDAAGRALYLPPDEATDSWIGSRARSLLAVTTRFRAHREAMQKRSGFLADDATQTLAVEMKFSSPVPLNEVLYPRTGYGILGADPSGKAFRVTRVSRSFRYHPAYGEVHAQTKTAGRSGAAKALLFEPDGSTEIVAGTELLVVDELDKDLQVIRTVTVRADADGLEILAEVFSGALYWAFASAMGNIQGLIERYVNTLLDLAELIPGWGQAITAARIVATISQFWAEGIYDDMLKVINGDLKEMLTGLVDKLSEVARPGAMLELLLFGDARLDGLLASSTQLTSTKSDKMMASRPSDTRSKLGALKKTFASLMKLGRAFGVALRKLHHVVQQPMQDTREYVSTRPTLSFAMHFAAAHIYEVMELAKQSAAIMAMLSEDDRKDASLVDQFRKSLGAEQADLGARLRDLLARLAELELPETIVDIRPAVQFVLDEMAVFVGNRLGIKGKVVTLVLQGSGVLDLFTSRVADAIVSRGFDPNVYWRDEVIPKIADTFNATRDSLLKDMNDLLAKPAFDGMFSNLHPGPALVLEPNTDVPYKDMPQPYPSPDRTLVPQPRTVPTAGAGQPMSDTGRDAFERAFGQDFANVRLHTGAEGDAMTRAFGAEALTAGSHVFLRAGLDPRTGAGEKVMRHELAHVLQQTGPRPLGRKGSSRPTAARPERGLRFDPAAEAQAERMAAAARARVVRGTPLGGSPVGGTQPAALQPYQLEDLDPYQLARILRGFNKLDAVKKHADEKHAEADKKTTTLAALSRADDTTAINAVLAALSGVKKRSSPIKIQTPAVFSGPIDSSGKNTTPVLDKIFAELDKKLDADHFKKVVFKLAAEAEDQIPEPPKPGPRRKPTPKSYVNPRHFARQLEGYILGKTGVALAIDLKTKDLKSPRGDVLQEINPADPIASLKLLHLYLPYVAPNAELSIYAITNTWPSARTDDKLKANLSGLVRSHLAGLGIRATVWALFGKDYKFSILFRRDIDTLMSAKITSGGALDPNSLTAPDEYADTDLTRLSSIGLRLATYGHDKSQKGAGRHSHHLTQFLVAEYFANANDGKKPFKKGRKYPGVKWDGDVVEFISADPMAFSSGVHVKDTFGGSSERGGKMPALSLAASTHMGADLHITPGPDDLGGSVKKTQAYAVDTTFRSKLPDDALKAEAKDTAYQKYLSGKPESSVAASIHQAVLGTFRHWAKHMNDQLEANMPKMELAYYAAVATGHTKDPAITKVGTDKTAQDALLVKFELAAKEAVKHNYSEMAKYNWTRS